MIKTIIYTTSSNRLYFIVVIVSNGEVVSITGKAAVTEADTGNLVVAFDNLDSKFIINYLLPNCIKLLFFYQISRLLLTIWCLALTTTRTLSFGVVPTSGFSTRVSSNTALKIIIKN